MAGPRAVTLQVNGESRCVHVDRGASCSKCCATSRGSRLAAESWGTRADRLRVAEGAVIDPKRDRRVGYGALVKGRDLSAELDADADPLPHDRWRQLVDRPDLPSAGAGETPIVAVAPAIANAIFHAAGRRLRDLPLAPDGCVRGQ